MDNTENYLSYARLADELIDRATKEQPTAVVQLLALNIGYYHEKLGDVPQETLLQMVRAETLDEETKRPLLQGMQNLVSALGEVMGLSDIGEEDAVH